MNFLNKANDDPSAGAAQAKSEKQGTKEFKAADKGAEIPQPLVAATKEAFYVSDADEPFVPVSLAWKKGEGLPDEGMWVPSVLCSSDPVLPGLLRFNGLHERHCLTTSYLEIEEIAQLVEHWDPASAEVEILDPTDWDRSGQYKDIIDAVTKAGKGNDVRVYRIVKDSSRVEYFVVTRLGDGKNARLVGVKALAIES